MIKNFLKVAVRNMSKQKSYSFINIFSLATGLAACILISLWVADEFNFNRFQKNWTASG